MGLTYILIKPEAIEHTEEIKRGILTDGFEILEEKEIKFTYDKIREIYPAERLNYKPKRVNESMSIYIASAYLGNFRLKAKALLLRYEDNAIKKLVELCGPTDAKEYKKPKHADTLRGRYGLGPKYNQKIEIDDKKYEVCFNGIHRPKTKKELKRGVKILFPELSL